MRRCKTYLLPFLGATEARQRANRLTESGIYGEQSPIPHSATYHKLRLSKERLS